MAHVHGRTAPPPDLYEHTDQTSDHLMGEGVRSNLELDRGAGLAPHGALHGPDERLVLL